jgi:hypothetical protein
LFVVFNFNRYILNEKERITNKLQMKSKNKLNVSSINHYLQIYFRAKFICIVYQYIRLFFTIIFSYFGNYIIKISNYKNKISSGVYKTTISIYEV